MNNKANVIIEAGIMLFVMIILLCSVMSIIGTNYRHFCYAKGYKTQDYWKVFNNDNMEDGYFKCCNDTIANYTITGQHCNVYTEQERTIWNKQKK